MTSQGSSEDWETESETSCMDVSSSADVTEMEVSVEISGIARRRETKSVSFAVFGALGENEEERVKENDEVVRVNEKEEEEYRKDLQFLVEKETEDEEEEDTSQCSEQEEQVKEAKQAMEVEQEEAEIPVNKVAPPQVRLTRPSDEWSRSDFQVQLELELPRADEDSRPDSQLSHRPEEISSSVYNWVCIGRYLTRE